MFGVEPTPDAPLPCGCIWPDMYRCALHRDLAMQYCQCDCHHLIISPSVSISYGGAAPCDCGVPAGHKHESSCSSLNHAAKEFEEVARLIHEYEQRS